MAGDFGADGQGRLGLPGVPEVAGAPGSPWDAEVLAGWDPGEEEDPWADCGDGPQAWLRSLPAELRVEVSARPAVTALPWEASPAAARGSFAGGGLGDAMAPGRLLGQLLCEATAEGYRELADDELAGVLRACQRQVAHGQARLAAAVRALAARRAAGSSRAAEHVADELAVELTLTGRAAGRMLALAAGLGRLGAVDDALLAGQIDWPRACVLVDELAVLDDASAQQVAERLTGRAAGWTTGQLRAALARAVLAADPGAAGRRTQAARKEARVELWHEGSGNAALAGRELRPASAVILDRKLTAHAAWLAARGVPGTQDQLRALAYTTLLSGRDLASIPGNPACWPQHPRGHGGSARSDGPGAYGHGGAAAGPGGPPQPAGSIHLTVPLSAWASAGGPGEVAGYGPADAQTSRELAGLLAADPATRWCLTLTGAHGQAVAHACAPRGPAPGEPVTRWAAGLRQRLQVLAAGPCRHARQCAAYLPPPRLRHLVQTRQRQCCFPGCRHPARRCDLDHTIPYQTRGLTCECNLAPLCRRHHRAKQAPGWHLTQDLPGHMTWRLPSGREYQTTGESYAA